MSFRRRHGSRVGRRPENDRRPQEDKEDPHETFDINDDLRRGAWPLDHRAAAGARIGRGRRPGKGEPRTKKLVVAVKVHVALQLVALQPITLGVEVEFFAFELFAFELFTLGVEV